MPKKFGGEPMPAQKPVSYDDTEPELIHEEPTTELVRNKGGVVEEDTGTRRIAKKKSPVMEPDVNATEADLYEFYAKPAPKEEGPTSELSLYEAKPAKSKKIPAFPKELNAAYEAKLARQREAKGKKIPSFPKEINQKKENTAYRGDKAPVNVEVPPLNVDLDGWGKFIDQGATRKIVQPEEATTRMNAVEPEVRSKYEIAAALERSKALLNGNERFTVAEGVRRLAVKEGQELLKQEEMIDDLQRSMMRTKIDMSDLFPTDLSTEKLADRATYETPSFQTLLKFTSPEERRYLDTLIDRMVNYKGGLDNLNARNASSRLRYSQLKRLADTLDDPKARLTENQTQMLFGLEHDMRAFATEELGTVNQKTGKEREKALRRAQDAARVAHDLDLNTIPADLVTEVEALNESDLEKVDEAA